MKKLYLYLFFFLALFVASVGSANTAEAIEPFSLEGYAWSDTIGWISLSCKDGGVGASDVCATSDYGVQVDVNGNFDGWGWSSNIGWVKFFGLSVFPTGGSDRDNPKIVGTYPNYEWRGWVRACSPTGAATPPYEGGECLDMDTHPNSGRWDGWISFGGTGLSHKITMQENASGDLVMSPNSYAWGSDVVGWVDMWSYVKVVSDDELNKIKATNCTILKDQSTCESKVTWEIDSAVPAANRSVKKAGTQFSTAQTGTNVIQNIGHGNTVFTVNNGSTVLAQDTAVGSCASGTTWDNTSGTCKGTGTPPDIAFEAKPPIVRVGGRTTLDWEITNITNINECKLSGTGISGSETNITVADGDFLSDPLTSMSRFNITCIGSYGEVSESLTVEVIPVAQEV